MIEILFAITWTCLGTYIAWYIFKAKTHHPLSIEELTLTWQIHKNQARCNASTIHTIHVKNNSIVGFTCDCGYNYLQKRLITQKITAETQPKTETALLKIKDQIKSDKNIQKLDLTNTQIHKIK
ncbi:MAG: hypothetical protein QCH99_02040 [Candidatus Bathyarchaeota archaeon]|nr:hypothetical protein [Candidatus Bathyarchaeum tardum]